MGGQFGFHLSEFLVVDSMMTKETLQARLRLPFEVKVRMTQRRISDFVSFYGEDGVYISFSGGKDSLVVLDIARKLYPNLKAAYCDTWLEMPQVRRFVKGFDNVDIVKPAKPMKQIIKEEGWCFPSKEVASAIRDYRMGMPYAVRKLQGLDPQGRPSEYKRQFTKWLALADSDIPIGGGCCDEQKEKPVALYEKETGRHPIIGLLAVESMRRRQAYLKTGCNSFDRRQAVDSATGEAVMVKNIRPMSRPIGFWTDNDVFRYIYQNGISIAEPYGEVVPEGTAPGQLSFIDTRTPAACEACRFTCSGEKRTGCLFCPIGCHLDNFAKFRNLRSYSPRLYEYCMEELGEKRLLEWIDRNIVHSGTY